MNWKSNLMKTLYQIGQSQRFYGVLAGVLVIAALYYENIPVINEWGFWGKLSLAFMVLLIFVLFGYIYDRKLRLWEDDSIINMERNPYTFDLLTPKEKKHLHILLTQMKATNKIHRQMGIEDKALADEISIVEKWIKEGRVNGRPDD